MTHTYPRSYYLLSPACSCIFCGADPSLAIRVTETLAGSVPWKRVFLGKWGRSGKYRKRARHGNLHKRKINKRGQVREATISYFSTCLKIATNKRLRLETQR